MPLIEVKLIEGVFSQKQKQEMITKLTDAMVSVEGENMRGVTFVLVEEVKSGDWGIGGKPMSAATSMRSRTLPLTCNTSVISSSAAAAASYAGHAC